MKFKFLCLVLAVMMMLAVLTSCSGSEKSVEDIASEAKRATQTLVVYLMSEKEISEQVASDIEDEINRITKSAYKTQLDIHFFTEDKYYAAVEKQFKEKEKELKKIEKEQADKKKIEKALRESCKKAGISYIAPTTPKQETVVTEEATLVNKEYGTIEYVYPDPRPNQLDIFYVGNYDKYMDYMYNDWLADLKEELTTSSKQLNEHINEVYMSNIDNGGIYGIPTNSVVGEYTWMLLDKGLMDEYLFTEDSINNITDENLFRFLSDVKANEPNCTPISGTIAPTNIYYWSVDSNLNRLTNKPSILCGSFDRDVVVDKENLMKVESLFENQNYIDQITAIKRMELEGYLTDSAVDEEPGTSAVKFVKGGYEVFAENHYDPENNLNGQYYVKMLERPRASVDEVFAHMLCVNALEDNIARTMEVITCININEEARNILQYGIEGENYYIDEDGVLHRYNDTYMMDINKTGNVFTAHPEEGLPANYWDYGIRQNTDALIIPVYSFDISEYEVDTESLDAISSYYTEYMTKLDAATTLDEFKKVIDEARTAIRNDENYKYATNINIAFDDEDDIISLATAYQQWLIAMKYVSLN